MAKKRSKSSLGWLWWLMAVVLLAAIGLIVFSCLPNDSIPVSARQAHQRVVDARSRTDGTSRKAVPHSPAAAKSSTRLPATSSG